MGSDMKLDVEEYLKDNAQRILESLSLTLRRIFIKDMPVGLCSQLSEYMVNKDYEMFNVWFTPERFDIRYLYKVIRYPGVNCVDCIKVVNGTGIFNYRYWYKYKIEDIPEKDRYKFYWYPLSMDFNRVRYGLLDKAIFEFRYKFLKGYEK